MTPIYIKRIKGGHSRHDYSTRYTARKMPKTVQELAPEKILPRSVVEMVKEEVLMELRENHEHIAGPRCQSDRGYDSHFITAEEIEGCNTHQSLVPKESRWIREADDQDYELESQ